MRLDPHWIHFSKGHLHGIRSLTICFYMRLDPRVSMLKMKMKIDTRHTKLSSLDMQ